jgi:conjugative transfer signal peptidase TraF
MRREDVLHRHPRGDAVAVCAAGALLLGTLLMARAAGLRVNATPSMPRGLWRVTPAEPPLRRGQIVTVCPPDTPAIREAARRGYIPAGTCPGGYEPLVKPVAAVTGDRVTVSAAGVAVNGAPIASTAQRTEDSAGRPLESVTAGIYQVTRGEVWILSAHDSRSFDSRYFGPVPVKNILGEARPLLVIQ